LQQNSPLGGQLLLDHFAPAAKQVAAVALVVRGVDITAQAHMVADTAGVGHDNGLASGAQLKTQVDVFAAVDKLLGKAALRIKVGLA
jgi:hypothetical protein